MKKHLCIYWCNNHNKTEKQADDKQAILPREWLEWNSKWLKVLGQWLHQALDFKDTFLKLKVPWFFLMCKMVITIDLTSHIHQ